MASVGKTADERSTLKRKSPKVTSTTAGTLECREAENAAAPCTDPVEEMMHLQADGFWGFEKGFHDAEERRQ